MDAAVYLREAGVGSIPEARILNRAEEWATFLLVLVGGLVLLALMGVVVGPWFDHAFAGLFHTLSSPLVTSR